MNLQPHYSQLSKIADLYGLPLEIQIVSDIQEWCSIRGIEENNPFLAGKCLLDNTTGKYLVLLREEITPEIKESAINAMQLREIDTKPINDTKKFVIHLLLHEIAHAANSEWSESECDLWALDQINKHPFWIVSKV